MTKEAASVGYALVDTAREYRNELLIGNLFYDDGDLRDKLFLQSKVWPTDLGFKETLDAMDASMNDLRTSYLDNYQLHWPFCDEEWMNCGRMKNKDGTWQSSYEAMRKYYAEGKILSIGVSNF